MRFPQICFGLGLAMAFTFAFAQGAPIVRSSLSVRDSSSGRALNILNRGEPGAGSANNVEAQPQGSANSQDLSNKNSLSIQLTDIKSNLRYLRYEAGNLLKFSGKNQPGVYYSYESVENEMMNWENIKNPSSEQEEKAKTFLTKNEKKLADRLVRYKQTPQENSDSQNTGGKENLTIKDRFINLFNGLENILKTMDPKSFDFYSRVDKEITAWSKVENPSAEKMEEMETFIKKSREELEVLQKDE